LRAVITGYASLDYALGLDRPPEADRTATILWRADEFPRLGGSPAYVAAAMRAGGETSVAPVTWVGDDEAGARYREALVKLGLPTAGVGVRHGPTPVCMLAYEPGGGCHCFYHPGLPEPISLDEAQRALVAAAELICVTVGPEQVTREVLSLARPEADLVWAVKADARAAPPDLAVALAARADVIVASRGEAAFVRAAFAAGGARRGALYIETRGAEGAAIRLDGAETIIPAQPVKAADTTGAGDTFLGGFLAAWRGGDARRAVEKGMDAARALITSRPQRDEESGSHVA
jgi:ribokinase